MNQIVPNFEFTNAYKQLTPPQRAFVDGYVHDLEGVADRTGEKLYLVLQQPFPYELDQRSVAMLEISIVRIAISDRVREICEDAVVSIGKTLKELTSIAYSNINNYMKIGVDGLPVFSLDGCTPEQMSAIKTIKLEQTPGKNKFEFQQHDKLKALEMLMKYQGLLDGEHNRNEKLKEATTKRLDADVTTDQAANRYAMMING